MSMSRADLSMTLALVGSLALSAVAVAATRRNTRGHAEQVAADTKTVRDSTGTPATAKRYQRIASGSILSDRLLLELCEPERIVALSEHGLAASSVAYRYGKRPTIDLNGDLEALVRLSPDLLLANNLTEERRVARLREAGITVFELGTMRGLQSLLGDIITLSTLIGEPERGRALANGTRARMTAIAIDIPAARRKSGVYVGIHGTQFYGGARGTSYHDVLVYAGLRDAAAERFEDWPAYNAEDLLALDPDVVLTVTGQRRALCAHPALRALRACGANGQVVELDQRLLVDPGLAMIDAAIAVRDAVYGPIAGDTP